MRAHTVLRTEFPQVSENQEVVCGEAARRNHLLVSNHSCPSAAVGSSLVEEQSTVLYRHGLHADAGADAKVGHTEPCHMADFLLHTFPFSIEFDS